MNLNAELSFPTVFHITTTATMAAFLNTTIGYTNGTENIDDPFSDIGFFVKHAQLIKAVVLSVVVMILVLSACRFVLKTFSGYIEHDHGKG